MKLKIIAILMFCMLALTTSITAVKTTDTSKNNNPIITLGNNQPYPPTNPSPSDGSVDVITPPMLSWDCSDPDGDPLKYDLYVGTSPETQKLWEKDISENFCEAWMCCNYGTTYYWYIKAKDPHGSVSYSDTWSFTTMFNEKPSKPAITGPSKGKAGVEYEFTFSSIDPDGDDVYFKVYWGDNPDQFQEWTDYVKSGEEITLTHTWDRMGIFQMYALACDPYGGSSEATFYRFTMPRSNVYSFETIMQRLQSKLNIFTILQKILQA